MSDETALVPTEIRSVTFYGDVILGAIVQVDTEARIYVPLRPICHYLGLDWSAQYRRTRRDEVLTDELRFIRIERSESVAIMATDSQRGDPTTICLPLDLLPGWLFGITTTKVKPEIRDKIILYRRECYRRLWDAFKNEILPSAAITPAPQLGGAALAYELATAVQNLAREQMELEQRMGRAAQWAKGIEGRVTALEVRLSPLEAHLSPDTSISNAQAGELALTVKTVANALEQRGQARGYHLVYGELYRRFSITGYKHLPQARFAEALDWLRAWYDEITKG